MGLPGEDAAAHQLGSLHAGGLAENDTVCESESEPVAWLIEGVRLNHRVSLPGFSPKHSDRDVLHLADREVLARGRLGPTALTHISAAPDYRNSCHIAESSTRVASHAHEN